MAADKNAKQATPAPLSFTDTYGATVSIAADAVQDYTGIKVEQLRAVTQLLASAASGGIELSPSATRDFTLMANSLAHEVEDLLSIAAMAAAGNAEGGA